MDRKQLKDKAKELRRGNFGILLLPFIITVLISAVLGALSVAIIPAILIIVVPFYLVTWYIQFVRTNEKSMNNFFKAISSIDEFLKVFLAMFLMTIFISLWSLLLFIPGIIATYAYSQTIYILVDKKSDKNFSCLDCIKLSKDMMKGHKFELFVLQLSFIGWALLTMLTFGILALWVAPYQQLTMTLYYENLKKEYEEKNPGTFTDLSIKANETTSSEDEGIVEGDVITDPFKD